MTVETATQDRFVPFRGALRAALDKGNVLVFVTEHEEGIGTAVHRLDVDKAELKTDALPCGASAIVDDGAQLFVAGTDGQIYRGPSEGGALSPLGDKIEPAPTALALLAGDRIAAISGANVALLSRKNGKLLQTLPLPDAGTALAADASGVWLAAGTSRGVLAVFDCEEKANFLAGESSKIHEGAVAALLFDPDELRVYSTGADNRLLLTHVRGTLEPEDRTGGSGHEGLARAIALGLEDKLYTAGKDGAIKTWTRGPRKRPSTFKEGVGSPLAMLQLEHKGRVHLALLCEDNTIRLFALDAGGKISQRALTFRDAYALAGHEFASSDPSRRQKALETLAGYGDARSIDLLARRASEDPDHALRARAARLLGELKSPRVVKALEALLRSNDEDVRIAALEGLRAYEGESSLRPLELAIAVKRRDIGVRAVEALTALANKDDLAMARLVGALDEDPIEVRVAALEGLESLFDSTSPEADLTALRSKRNDIRQRALVRFFQRKFLDHAEVQTALRRHQGDADADVRRVAFLVAVMSRPALADALRARDKDIERQLSELENIGKKPAEGEPEKEAEPAPEPPKKGAKGKKAAKASAPSAPRESKREALPSVSLSDDDLRPLFEAMASRALDTCLVGARGLAALHDARAFGTLLQLTNEKNASARVEACKALAELGDVRGEARLRQMLRDSASEVRDAAFSALARLQSERPLDAAEAGLLAPNDDVRGRGLSLLVRTLKAGGAPSEAALALLERALSDTSSSVRGEAFKATLSLDVGGGGAETLRFAARSIHADVRREVLNEVTGRVQESWAPALLLEIFGDPDASVRDSAFEFAQKRSKGKSIEPLEAAIKGKHSDLKLKAIAALDKRRVGGAGALLLRALDDEDDKVRVAASLALSPDEAATAMDNAHPDVRVRAAATRAVLGDARALAPLVAIATEKEPDLAEKRGEWIDRTVRALDGLGELGAPEAAAAVTALLTHKEKRIRDAAVRAFGWIARQGMDLAPLRLALSHSDADVKREAALGLAQLDDTAGLPVIRGLVQQRGELAMRGLTASLALGEKAADLFMAYLDHTEERVRQRALLFMMLIESSEQDGVPDRCLAALSSSQPRVRLEAARALESFADPAAFRAFVLELLNDRGEGHAPWTIPADTGLALAELLTHADPQLKVRSAQLLKALDAEKQDTFDRAWAVFAKRFDAEIKKLLTEAKKRKAAPPQYAPEELSRVVLGAYAGLSRQEGGALGVRVRQTAIARLVAMATASSSLVSTIQPLLLIALGDPNAAVRKAAFEALRAIGASATELGAEALSVGQRDVGAMGLGLLAESGDAARRAEVLERVMLSNTDGLEEEAAKLLAEERGLPQVFAAGLEARSEAQRSRSVSGLEQQYDASELARDKLRAALASRYRAVREQAAFALGRKKDAAAFDALKGLLAGEAQSSAINALKSLGDPRAPSALLDRVDNDPAGTARVDDLIAAAGSFRLPEIADRLIALLDDKKKRRAAFAALFIISGYDQRIFDPNDEGKAAPGWESTQHPRNDEILAKLLDAAYRLGDASMLGQLIPGARWSKSQAVDSFLAPLASFPNDQVRDRAVEAIGFRLKKRGGSAEPLIAALGHKSPATQLMAAESLARAGRAEGIKVLLTSIDLLPGIDDRRRAVRALGELGDARALDPLLRLVNEDGHALQEEAAEAIGHLKSTPKAKQIEELLLRLGKGPGGVAAHALVGLRWFDSQEGWALIRSRATDESAAIRQTSVRLLAHDTDPAGREVLERAVTSDSDIRVAREAAASMRAIFGADSLEPDYILARSHFRGLEPRTVERLKESGDPARILELLPKIPSGYEAEILRPLVGALLVRDPLPLAAARDALTSPHERVAAVAAQILGRAGRAAAKEHGEALVLAARSAAEAWNKARADVDRRGPLAATLGVATERYVRTISALGKLQIGAAEVIPAASLGGDDALARPIRHEALTVLASGFAGDPGIDALAAAVTSHDAHAREIAAAALAKLAPARAAALAEKAIDDRPSLGRLLAGHVRDAIDTLRTAALRVHTQGVALPLLVASGDVEGLAAALADKSLSEATRLGAIEALARVATEAARAPLVALAKNDAEDEELRKAAWRALRRSRRYEAKDKNNKNEKNKNRAAPPQTGNQEATR